MGQKYTYTHTHNTHSGRTNVTPRIIRQTCERSCNDLTLWNLHAQMWDFTARVWMAVSRWKFVQMHFMAERGNQRESAGSVSGKIRPKEPYPGWPLTRPTLGTCQHTNTSQDSHQQKNKEETFDDCLRWWVRRVARAIRSTRIPELIWAQVFDTSSEVTEVNVIANVGGGSSSPLPPLMRTYQQSQLEICLRENSIHTLQLKWHHWGFILTGHEGCFYIRGEIRSHCESVMLSEVYTVIYLFFQGVRSSLSL